MAVTPLNLQATPGDGVISLAWTAPNDVGNAVIDYCIVYQDGVDVMHPTETSATVSALTNGQTYEFSVAAHSADGTGVPCR